MREPRLPRLLPEVNNPDQSKRRPRVVEERFDLRGYETSADVGFSPELQPDSQLEPLVVPTDLRGDELARWLQTQGALLGLRHAYFLLAHRDTQLKPLSAKNVYFFGTQFKREGRLYVPALVRPVGSWTIRLDPWDVRLDERDSVLRLQPKDHTE